MIKSKRLDFITYCLQSDDPALAPPAPTPTGHRIRFKQQRYYFNLYTQLREEYMRNSSVTSAYTQFIQQWKKEDDGEDQKRQATAAITTNKNKIKEELCLMEQQKSSQQHRQLYEQIKVGVESGDECRRYGRLRRYHPYVLRL